jgi:uncharacterized ion transporter superfamily protein YfcC
MVYGGIPWEDLGLAIPTWWWFPEMTACFLFFGIRIGIIGKLPERTLVDTFVDGAKEIHNGIQSTQPQLSQRARLYAG